MPVSEPTKNLPRRGALGTVFEGVHTKRERPNEPAQGSSPRLGASNSLRGGSPVILGVDILERLLHAPYPDVVIVSATRGVRMNP